MRKKLLRVSLALLFALLFATPVFASDSRFSSDTEVNLSVGQEQAVLTLSIEENSPYAGAEFGVQCGAGVTVEKVEYDRAGVSSAGPADARGLTWFSFFAGDNRFQGKTTVALTVRYTGEGNGSLSVQYVSLYKNVDANIEETLLTPGQNILLRRAGDPTPVPPLTPPDGAKPAPGPDAPTSVNSQQNMAATSSGSYDSSASRVSAAGSTSRPGASGSENGSPTSTSSTSAAGSASPVASAAPARQTDISPEQKAGASVNTVLVVCLCASVALNLLLGGYTIKKKADQKSENKKEGIDV